MLIGIIARLFGLFGHREIAEAAKRSDDRRKTQRELSKLPPHILRDVDWPPKA
ncbi:hypothetical protein ACQQ2Q_08755 [Agrobacterium sp. ES01]|uniref:hypothetical protein n=1 Tax=Agrobacterium sp. ES01 TaxID=3420714 RepID=UPI003D0AABC3